MIMNHSSFLENAQNLMVIGKRALFIKSLVIDDLYGAKGFLYMILDPERKNKDIQSLGLKRQEELNKENTHKYDYKLKDAGIFMLISSKNIPIEEVLQAYYTRQSIEQIFGIC